MEILATYRAYKQYEKPFESWQQSQNVNDSKKYELAKFKHNNASEIQQNKEKAKVVTDSILVLDNYAQEKAEDVETVFQTLQMELIAGLTAISCIPSNITKLVPFLKKHAKDSKLAKGVIEKLTKYDSTKVNILKKQIPLPKVAKYLTIALSALVYIPLSVSFVKNQIGATRRAKFDIMNNELSDPKQFALLTPEQKANINTQIQNESNQNSQPSFFKKTKEKITESLNNVNVFKSMSSVKKLMQDKDNYKYKKAKYDKSLLENQKQFEAQISQRTADEAVDDKELFNNIIKKIDLDSHDKLERFEKVVNVGYATLFIGTFLESLLSEKITDYLKVRNPYLKTLLNIGIPIYTYLVLNKNLACAQNNAIRAVRYKQVQGLMKDDTNFTNYSKAEIDSIKNPNTENITPKKEGLFGFLKSIFKYIKEYKEYQKNELPKIQKEINLKKTVNLTEKQEKEATSLQKNTFMAVNKVADNAQKYSESIEALSEIALTPVELLSSIAGVALGKKLSSMTSNKVLKPLLTLGGAFICFIPNALMEIWTTHQQRSALRISNMLSMNELDDYRNFVDYDNKTFKQKVDASYAFRAIKTPQSFVTFQKNFDIS